MMMIAVLLLHAPNAHGQNAREIPISEVLRDVNRDQVPDRLGDTVEVVGIATTDPLVIGPEASLISLQDSSGGVVLFTRDTTQFMDLTVGDRVRVRGAVGQYRGVEQLIIERIERIGTAEMPAPRDVLAADLLGEQYTGQLVRVRGELIVSEAAEGPITAELRDRSGRVPIYIPSRLLSDPRLVQRLIRGGEAEIVGIASQYDTEAPYNSGYQLVPRGPGDFSLPFLPPYRWIAIAVLLGAVIILWVLRRRAARRADEMERLVGELRRSQEALQKKDAAVRRLAAIVESSDDAIISKALDGIILSWNSGAERVFGYSPTEAVGQPVFVLVPQDKHEEEREILERVARGESVSAHETVRTSKNGRRIPISLSVSPIRDAEGRVVAASAIARDSTERKAAEARLRESEERFRQLAENVESVFWLYDFAERRTIYISPAYERIWGRLRESVYAEPTDWRESLHPEDRERVIAVLDAHRVAGYEVEYRIVRPDGEIRWIRDRGFPVRDAEGQVIRTAGLAEDITEEIDREKRLRRAERLAGVGTLIGGVAHELNNPLSAIRSFADLLLLEPRPEEEREDLETIRREADRMAKIVSNLRTVARETQGEDQREREAVDLNDIVRHVLKVRRYGLETHNTEVRQDLGERLPRVWANRSEIEQVVLNLVVNAEQALAGNGEDGRRLIIRTRPCLMGAAVHVIDNGPGIPPEDLDRIFDPFYTTKDPGEGTGLGLSLVHSIVADHEGEIRVESEPGRGAAFMVGLPSAREEKPKPAAAPEEDARSAPGLRILVVDDEEAIRRSLSRFLSRRGHRLDTAAEGREALRLLERGAEADPYDVILSDLRMPGVGGEELLQRLREQGSSLAEKVVFMTGDAVSPDVARFLQAVNAPTLLKPFALDQVAERIERFAEGGGFD